MREIAGRGTSEEHWRDWLARRPLPEVVPPAVAGDGPRVPRAVVLAAHPDDEVLAAGGLLSRLSRAGWRVDVVWASDGEASHPGSSVVPPAELGRRRRAESMAARSWLGLTGSTTWLGLPDSGLGEHEDRLRGHLDVLAAGADLLLSPWAQDGHPDHEVCGRVARAVAGERGLPSWQLPIWAWHWDDGASLAASWDGAAQVTLDDRELQAKTAAVAEFVSQVDPVGPDEADAAVLPPHVLARFLRPVEIVLDVTATVLR